MTESKEQNGQIWRLQESLKLIEKAEDFVIEKLGLLGGEVKQLCDKVEVDRVKVEDLIAKRKACDNQAREQLLRYQRALDSFAFDAAEGYLEQAGNLKRKALIVSQEIGMFIRKANRHKQQIKNIGKWSSELAEYADRMAQRAVELRSESQQLLNKVEKTESDINLMKNKATEES